MPEKIRALENRLREIAARNKKLAVAFSGGLDSRFLIHMALRAGLTVTALHANGPHIPSLEHAYAARWARENGVAFQVAPLDPLTDERLRNNPKDRCYHCKKTVFTALSAMAGNLPLCDGTNASDLGEHRPGLRALTELEIFSPLAECGITKEDIRAMGTATGLTDPDQAAQPCLLTRFAYGHPLDAAELHAVDQGENAVREVLQRFGKNIPFRLRFEAAASPALHLALDSVPENLRAALADALQGAGFPGTPIRAVPSLSGYFDRAASSA